MFAMRFLCCVDLCSGVRTEGRLDPAKLAAFMAAVHDADLALASALNP